MNTRLSVRQMVGIASLLVALLVNLPLITLANRPTGLLVPGLPDTLFTLFRLIFHFLFTFFFIELNRHVLGEKRYRPWMTPAAWYGLNFLLYLVLTGCFVAVILTIYPSRPMLVVVSSFFRGFLIWGTALLIAHFLTLLEQNRRMQRENDQLKQESLQAQLDGLRAQLNPHFLFNSLNTLSSLIREGNAETLPYVSKLSQVLRYSLQVQNQPLVPFSEEMQVTRAYSFLLRLRFGKNLQLDNALDPDAPWLIPPMALQLLIENAVKHNIVSQAKPLRIQLRVEPSGDYVCVRNTNQPKLEPVDGTGTGLANLENRFRLLCGKSIRIIRTNQEFCVCLPIIPAS